MAVKFSQILSEIGTSAQLKMRGPIAFGLYRGYLITLKDFSQSGQFALIATFPRKEDTGRVAQYLDKKTLLKMVGAMGNLIIEPGVVALTIVPKWKVPDVSQVKGLLDTVIGVLSANTPPYQNVCDECGVSSADVILVNGIPSIKCSPCTEKIRKEVEGVQSEWDAKKPNYKKGMTYALLAVFISAFAWALIAYALQMIIFYAGFIIGMFVGFTLVYGTEKITGEIIALAVGLTLFAVILGEVLYVAFVLIGEGISLGYLPEAFGNYIELAGGEFLGAIITGLIGAGIVAFNLYSQGRQKTPEVEIVT
jgi:hypothetical protein